MLNFGNWTPDLCIYHANCQDGFAAALLVWRKWPNCTFVPGQYGKPLPNMIGMNVLMVDFSASADDLLEAARAACSIIVIDHHKTAEAELAPFRATIKNGLIEMARGDVGTLGGICVEHYSRGTTPIIAFFDQERSGASLTWDLLYRKTDRDDLPAFIAYVEDRDLWRFAHGDVTRQFSAALRSFPQDFHIWKYLFDRHDLLIKDGEAILRAHRTNMKRIMTEAYWTVIAGHRIPVVNAPYHYASDIANELLDEHQDAPFAASWFHRGDGVIQWSLRSEDHRIDVSEIAKSFGGGGHRNSAGFQQSVSAFFGEADLG